MKLICDNCKSIFTNQLGMVLTCPSCGHSPMRAYSDSAGPDTSVAGGDQGLQEKVVQGVGPDAPIVTNDKGGKQSYTPYGFILMDPKAMFKLAEVLQKGKKIYGRDNWRKVDCEDHVNHALAHIYAWIAGDTQDDHLSHAFCRLMMAIGTEKKAS